MFDFLSEDQGHSPREMIAASGKKEIYTFTPKGDRIFLPLHSTVLDFAYQVHTEVGRRCAAAQIGSNRVEPDHILKDGDQVKIILQEKPVLFEPRLQELCKTPRARSGLAKGFGKYQIAVLGGSCQSGVSGALKGIASKAGKKETFRCDSQTGSAEQVAL